MDIRIPNLFLRWIVDTLLPLYREAGRSCSQRCVVKTCRHASQGYSSTSGMSSHLCWPRRSHLAEHRRQLTNRTSKRTTLIPPVESIPVQPYPIDNETAGIFPAESKLIERTTADSSTALTIPAETAPATPNPIGNRTALNHSAETLLVVSNITNSRTTLNLPVETALVQPYVLSNSTALSSSAELALTQRNLTDHGTMLILYIETVSVKTRPGPISLTSHSLYSKANKTMSGLGEKRPRQENDEGEFLVAIHTHTKFLNLSCAYSISVLSCVTLLSSEMEVDVGGLENKRQREDDETNQLLEDGKFAVKLLVQERANDILLKYIALKSNLKQRNQRALPRADLFVLKFTANTLPGLFQTSVQVISRHTPIGTTDTTVAVGEEAELLEEVETKRSKRSKRKPMSELNPDQQAKRRETLRARNLRRKERKRQAQSSTTNPARTEEAPGTSKQTSPSAGQPKPGQANPPPQRQSQPGKTKPGRSQPAKAVAGRGRKPVDSSCNAPHKLLIKKKDGGPAQRSTSQRSSARSSKRDWNSRRKPEGQRSPSRFEAAASLTDGLRSRSGTNRQKLLS